MQDANQQEPPSSVLKNEHRIIERVLGVLERLVIRSERGDGFEVEALKQCVTFFRLFADACHHAKEEDLLFPVLERCGIPRDGGPIGVMLHEHTQAREFTRRMGEALSAFEAGDEDGRTGFRAAARDYLDLLPNHIHKEDNILYNMGDRVMSDEDQQGLSREFCSVGCREFGGKKREELEAMADSLESRWGG